MSVTNTGILGLMTAKLSYLGQKQAVLAENVANADTPGYKAKEIVPFSFDDAMNQVQRGMVVTDVQHIVPASMVGVNAATKTAKSFETLPSGNSVDLEQQMMQVSSTTMDYQASASIFQKFMSLLKQALGK